MSIWLCPSLFCNIQWESCLWGKFKWWVPSGSTDFCLCLLFASVDLAAYFLLTVDFLITWDLLVGYVTPHLSKTPFQMEISLERPRKGLHQRKAIAENQINMAFLFALKREPVYLQMGLWGKFTFCLFPVISCCMQTSGRCPLNSFLSPPYYFTPTFLALQTGLHVSICLYLHPRVSRTNTSNPGPRGSCCPILSRKGMEY